MRYHIVAWLSVLTLAANATFAATVSITLDARTLCSEVSYGDVTGGFVLDVFLEADEPMLSASITLDGNGGFHHLGTEGVPGMPGPDHYGPVWDGGGDVNQVPPGYLPLSGGIGNELSAEAWDPINGAANGLFAWLEFDELPPEGEYFIIPAGTVIGLDGLPMNIGEITPLHITPEPASAVLLIIATLSLPKQKRGRAITV